MGTDDEFIEFIDPDELRPKPPAPKRKEFIPVAELQRRREEAEARGETLEEDEDEPEVEGVTVSGADGVTASTAAAVAAAAVAAQAAAEAAAAAVARAAEVSEQAHQAPPAVVETVVVREKSRIGRTVTFAVFLVVVAVVGIALWKMPAGEHTETTTVITPAPTVSIAPTHAPSKSARPSATPTVKPSPSKTPAPSATVKPSATPTPVQTITYDHVQKVVGFNPDQASLTATGKAELDAAIAAIPAGATVDVYGYVWEGAPGSEFTLDTARAQTVAGYLAAHGVTVGTVQGLGKKQRGVVVAWMQPKPASSPAESAS